MPSLALVLTLVFSSTCICSTPNPFPTQSSQQLACPWVGLAPSFPRSQEAPLFPPPRPLPDFHPFDGICAQINSPIGLGCLSSVKEKYMVKCIWEPQTLKVFSCKMLSTHRYTQGSEAICRKKNNNHVSTLLGPAFPSVIPTHIKAGGFWQRTLGKSAVLGQACKWARSCEMSVSRPFPESQLLPSPEPVSSHPLLTVS